MAMEAAEDGPGTSAFPKAALSVQGLLEEEMERAMAESMELAEIISRMILIKGDARDILPELRPETVLIDPMHPPRGKSALVKNEMRQPGCA